jgi:hypothetical protein
MKAIPTAQYNSVVSLLNEGYFQCQIKDKTGVGKGTISRISKEVDGNKENNLGGRPSKLSARDKQSIIRQIKSGKLDNAIQATLFINGIIPTLSHPKQSEMCSRKINFMPLQRRKHLFLNKPIACSASSLQDIMKAGLWRTGKGFYGQMRPRSIGLG